MIALANLDRQTLWLLAGVVALLAAATLIGLALRLAVRRRGVQAVATVANLNARIVAWWAMAAVFALTLAAGRIGSAVLYGLVSLAALREFISLTPTRRGDHRALFWLFFIITPIQYYLVAVQWYGLFVIFIPVYAFLLVPIRGVLAGDCERFLERQAKIQWGLMIAVYCVSYAPALLTLPLAGSPAANVKLLIFLVLVVELSDVLQYVWGKTLGRRRIAPTVSPNKTWAGFVGGVASATAVGAALWWATPFSPLQATGMALVITLMGFGGGLVMSAVKRDRGVKDYGALIRGHGGMLDRIDSLCFAAPIFFHLTRYWFT